MGHSLKARLHKALHPCSTTPATAMCICIAATIASIPWHAEIARWLCSLSAARLRRTPATQLIYNSYTDSDHMATAREAPSVRITGIRDLDWRRGSQGMVVTYHIP